MRIMRNFLLGMLLLAVAGMFIACSGEQEQPASDSEEYVEFVTEEVPTETETEVVVPESVKEAFQTLNRIEDAAEFDEEYERVKLFLEDGDHEKEWNVLLRDVSAYYDYLQNKSLRLAMSEYSLTETSGGLRYLDLEGIAALVEEGFGSNFMDRLYVEGCIPKLPPAVWKQEDLYQYCGLGNALDMLMISADELVVPDADPQSRTALLVDASEAIYIEGMGLLPMTDVDNSEIAARAKKIYEAIGNVSNHNIIFTGNPALADLIITVKVAYPVCGTYWGGKRNVLVFGCRVNGSIRQVAEGKTWSFRAISEPDWRVDAEEGEDTYWMEFPGMVDEYSVKKCVKDVLARYGISIDIGASPYEPDVPQTSEQPEDTEDSQETEAGGETESTGNKKKKKKKKKQEQETQDGEDRQEGEDTQGGQDSQETQEGEDSRDSQGTQDGEDTQGGQDSQETQEGEDSRDSQGTQDGEDRQESGETQDSGDGQDNQEAQDGGDSQKAQDGGDRQEAQDGGDSQEAQNAQGTQKNKYKNNKNKNKNKKTT